MMRSCLDWNGGDDVAHYGRRAPRSGIYESASPCSSRPSAPGGVEEFVLQGSHAPVPVEMWRRRTTPFTRADVAW